MTSFTFENATKKKKHFALQQVTLFLPNQFNNTFCGFQLVQSVKLLWWNKKRRYSFFAKCLIGSRLVFVLFDERYHVFRILNFDEICIRLFRCEFYVWWDKIYLFIWDERIWMLLKCNKIDCETKCMHNNNN